MTFKDVIWLIGVVLALGGTWGMTSQRVSALEKDMDRLETSLQLLYSIDLAKYLPLKFGYIIKSHLWQFQIR